MNAKTKNYRVTIHRDHFQGLTIEASSPLEAARKARELFQGPGIAFNAAVTQDHHGDPTYEVDLPGGASAVFNAILSERVES